VSRLPPEIVVLLSTLQKTKYLQCFSGRGRRFCALPKTTVERDLMTCEKSQLAGSDCNTTIALVNWCHLIEDFIDNLGVSFDSFRTEFKGSWIIGYIEALARVGVRTVWFCVSARVTSPWRFVHAPTGSLVCVLPAPTIYRAIRRRILNPYATSVEQAVGNVHRFTRPLFGSLLDVASYTSTPLDWFRRELKRERCTAILCQEYENPRFDVSVLLGRLIGVPVFATFQGGQTQFSRLERLFRGAALQACAGLIIGSQTEVQRVSDGYGVPPSKIARIFNPIDAQIWRAIDRSAARSELGIPLNARVAVWHGRVLMHRKGLDILLQAWETVCRERPGKDLKLILLGTGNDADEFRERLNAMHLQGVLWMDQFFVDTTAIKVYLSAADVYVFPSRHEGFPVAPIEAMAAGLPVVAANAPGISDIFENGEDEGGLIVPVDDAAAFAHALGRMLDDVVWTRDLGQRAHRRAQTSFSLEAIGAQLSSFMTGRDSHHMVSGHGAPTLSHLSTRETHLNPRKWSQ